MATSEGEADARKKMQVDLEDNSKVSKRDIYNRLCACRDFEIKLQWERAVFLTAFLIACFAGYGGFALSVHQHGVGQLSPFVINMIPICISVVGIVLSLFWIMMAKGSKAWYEHYESAIKAFSKECSDDKEVKSNALGHDWLLLPGLTRSSMSDSLIRLNGGCYSVSKIVIGIGILSLLIWSGLMIGHLLIWVLGPISTWTPIDLGKFWRVLIILVVCLALPAVTAWMTRRMRSGYLRKVKLVLSEEEGINKGEFKSFWGRLFRRQDLKVLERLCKKGEQGAAYLVIRGEVLKCFDSDFTEIERTKWNVEKVGEIVLKTGLGFSVKVIKLDKTEVVK